MEDLENSLNEKQQIALELALPDRGAGGVLPRAGPHGLGGEDRARDAGGVAGSADCRAELVRLQIEPQMHADTCK